MFQMPYAMFFSRKFFESVFGYEQHPGSYGVKLLKAFVQMSNTFTFDRLLDLHLEIAKC